MNPDLSRRVARIMGLIAMEISLEERSAFVDRLEQAGSFSELQEADQRAILAAERTAMSLSKGPAGPVDDLSIFIRALGA